MADFPNICVNLRVCLSGVAHYISTQAVDFIDLEQIPTLLGWKY